MKKILLFSIFCLGFITAQADVFTDGMAKRVSDGQIILQIPNDPLIEDLFDRSHDQMQNAAIQYIASVFREHMTEKEFGDWMNYKPSKEEKAYEESVGKMMDVMKKPAENLKSSDDILACLQAGKEAEQVKAKPCSASYRKAFDRFVECNGFEQLESMKSYAANLAKEVGVNDENALVQRSIDIYIDNFMATLLNSSIDNYSEKQLQDHSKVLPLSKQIKEIQVQISNNPMGLMQATFGIQMSELEGLIAKKRDALTQKYGNLKGRQIDFSVNYNNIKRAY